MPVGAGTAGEAPGWAGGYAWTPCVVVGGGGLALFWPLAAVCGVTPSALAALMGLLE